jgi:hypothetical protein
MPRSSHIEADPWCFYGHGFGECPLPYLCRLGDQFSSSAVTNLSAGKRHLMIDDISDIMPADNLPYSVPKEGSETEADARVEYK